VPSDGAGRGCQWPRGPSWWGVQAFFPMDKRIEMQYQGRFLGVPRIVVPPGLNQSEAFSALVEVASRVCGLARRH